MKKLVAMILTCLMLFTVTATVNAETITEADLIPEKIDTPIHKIDGKQFSYNLLHSIYVENMSEEQIIKLYYKLYLDREADDWDVEFWSKRITPTDTTILTYGLINSDTFKAKCEKYGFDAEEYFIEDGVFTEGECPLSPECGLTTDGDYVFYATFGDATYYHVTYGADGFTKK